MHPHPTTRPHAAVAIIFRWIEGVRGIIILESALQPEIQH